MENEKKIGVVTHFFGGPSAAVLSLSALLKVGDEIHIVGSSTDLVELISSMQIEHNSVDEANPGDDVAILVSDVVRAGDEVFLRVSESAGFGAAAEADDMGYAASPSSSAWDAGEPEAEPEAAPEPLTPTLPIVEAPSALIAAAAPKPAAAKPKAKAKAKAKPKAKAKAKAKPKAKAKAKAKPKAKAAPKSKVKAKAKPKTKAKAKAKVATKTKSKAKPKAKAKAKAKTKAKATKAKAKKKSKR